MTGAPLSLAPPLLLAALAHDREEARGRVDDDSFAGHVRRHRQHVYRVALSVLGPDHVPEAEDVTQDVFLRLFRSWGSLRGESELSTWLHRTAFNRAVDVRRRARFRRPHVPVDEIPAAAAPEPAADSEVLVQLVDRLPDTERAIVRLHYWMGYPAAEIARRLGMPDASVRSHLFRARRRLRRALRTGG